MKSNHRLWSRSPIALGLLLALWADASAYEPQVNYMLHCMGCHTPDGSGEPGRVPSVRNTLWSLAKTPAGRKFLVQVPGAAQSRLSDADLADVLNWMIQNLRADAGPQPFNRYTAAEVAILRHQPLVAVGAARARIVE